MIILNHTNRHSRRHILTANKRTYKVALKTPAHIQGLQHMRPHGEPKISKMP